ncbi:unnamed protein product [Pedinophyceae sp. YPF-701]|nr:unnamed protein product [Pedinophyceae sp. YPF-701]
MDHAEEQAMEIEALQAILMDDLSEYDGRRPDGWPEEAQMWTTVVTPLEDGRDRDEAPALLQIVFAYTERYPEEAPLLRLMSAKSLSDAKIREATAVAEEVVGRSLGMAMIYEVITACKDWLVAATGADEVEESEEQRKAREEEEEQKRREEVRRHGTPVTAETFAKWKEAYDAEKALERAKLMDTKAAAEKARRLTGRKYFETVHNKEGEGEGGEGEEEGSEGDYDVDEDEMLDDYLAEDSDSEEGGE